jgi:hypothetical protein
MNLNKTPSMMEGPRLFGRTRSEMETAISALFTAVIVVAIVMMLLGFKGIIGEELTRLATEMAFRGAILATPLVAVGGIVLRLTMGPLDGAVWAALAVALALAWHASFTIFVVEIAVGSVGISWLAIAMLVTWLPIGGAFLALLVRRAYAAAAEAEANGD